MFNFKNIILKNQIFLFFIIFIISRLFIHYVLEISSFELNYGYKLLELNLLTNDFLKSILFLHAQTPGWNIINGLPAIILNGDIIKLTVFFNIFHSLLTFLIIYYSILISREFNLSLKGQLIIFIFIFLHPTVIFYENFFDYNQISTFLFTQMSFFIIKFFKSNEKKYEIYIYLSLFTQGLFWAAFLPILILFIFIVIRFFNKASLNLYLIVVTIFFVSLTPHIKNKVIFGVFTNSSKSLVDTSVMFPDWLDRCVSPEKKTDPNFKLFDNIEKYFPYYEKIYFKKYNKIISHPAAVGKTSRHNNVAYFPIGENCRKLTKKKIFEDPVFFFNDRFKSFLASHGKFGFDFMWPKPQGWNKYYKFLDDLYKNPKIKLTRQIIIFILCMTVYLTLIYFILFSKKDIRLRKALFIIGLLYAYVVTACTLGTGVEQERYIYTGFISNILFVIIILKKFKSFTLKHI